MTREINDNYPTPKRLARQICRRVAETLVVPPETILEPSCGAGSFMFAARSVWPDAKQTGFDIDQSLLDEAHGHGFDLIQNDFLSNEPDTATPAQYGKFDLIIGNPPYKTADKFILRARKWLKPKGSLVFLLRLNFLGGQRRFVNLWQRWQPVDVFVLPKRPSFRAGSGTDMTEYAVYHWRRDANGPIVVDFIDNREVDQKPAVQNTAQASVDAA